jgi:hypothetical protein
LNIKKEMPRATSDVARGGAEWEFKRREANTP